MTITTYQAQSSLYTGRLHTLRTKGFVSCKSVPVDFFEGRVVATGDYDDNNDDGDGDADDDNEDNDGKKGSSTLVT